MHCELCGSELSRREAAEGNVCDECWSNDVERDCCDECDNLLYSPTEIARGLCGECIFEELDKD